MACGVNVVVSRYREALDWLSAMRVSSPDWCIHLYDKGGGEDECGQQQQQQGASVVALNNVGRESHTYLTHVLRQYDAMQRNPGGVTVFLQGRIDDHMLAATGTPPARFVADLVRQAAEHGYSANSVDGGRFGANGVRRDFTIACAGDVEAEGRRGRSAERLGPWFERCLGMRLPEPHAARWFVGGIFAVRHDLITMRGPDFYQRLLREVSHSRNPVQGHYMERSWFYIFSCHTRRCVGVGVGREQREQHALLEKYINWRYSTKWW